MPAMRRKPDWLKVKLPNTPQFNLVKAVIENHRLHSVCQEAHCPNIAECFHAGTATFLILGDTCTRNCGYCNVRHGIPHVPDEEEPGRLVNAVKALGLHYIVITSVTRDDLPDGGAGTFARCIEDLRKRVSGCRVEVLVPDFRGNWKALESVINTRPHVISHNMEVTAPLFPVLRRGGNYRLSLELLSRIRNPGITSKSGFMIGLGEERKDILNLLNDLADAGCERLTIGQYQQPRLDLWPVKKYYHPDEFDELKQIALRMGFRHVEAGPLIRSSYHAAEPCKR
jgi:lipoic acid synthetase